MHVFSNGHITPYLFRVLIYHLMVHVHYIIVPYPLFFLPLPVFSSKPVIFHLYACISSFDAWIVVIMLLTTPCPVSSDDATTTWSSRKRKIIFAPPRFLFLPAGLKSLNIKGLQKTKAISKQFPSRLK